MVHTPLLIGAVINPYNRSVISTAFHIHLQKIWQINTYNTLIVALRQDVPVQTDERTTSHGSTLFTHCWKGQMAKYLKNQIIVSTVT